MAPDVAAVPPPIGPIDVLGHSMVVDGYDTLDLARLGIHEPLATDLLLRAVEPGDVAIDVGANVGYFTLLLARAVGPTGHVHAFEPEPSAFELLERNIAGNGYRNVTAYRAAVGGRTGRAGLWVNAGSNQGDHRVYDPGEQREVVEVDMVRLEDTLRGVRPGIVKLDIQGAEHAAIEGMRTLLAGDHRLLVMTEFWVDGLVRCGTRPIEVLSLLEALNLTLAEVDEPGRTVDLTDAETLVSKWSARSQDFTTVAAFRGHEPSDLVAPMRTRDGRSGHR